MATQTNNPTSPSNTDADRSLYERLANKELEIVKSLEGKVDKLPEIPIVKAYFLWKVKDFKAQLILAQGIHPQTGQKIEQFGERLKTFAENEAEALKYGLQSSAEAVLIASGGQTDKFNNALKIFGRRGGEAELLENTPRFLRFVAGKLDDEAVKKALADSSGVIEKLLENPVTKSAMVNSIRNWGPWQKFTTEAQDEILQERILREAQQKFDTIENLSPAPTNILITLQPTLKETEKKVKRAWSKVQVRIKDLTNAGHVGLGDADKITLRDSRFPTGEFQGPEIAAAVNLYSKGARSKNLEDVIDKLSTLSRKDLSPLYRIAFVVAALEETYGRESRDIFTAQGEPTVTIQPLYGPSPVPQPNQMLMQRGEDGFFRPLLETGLDIARDKAKGLITNALKKGGNKLIAQGQLIAQGVKTGALKAGARLAVKAGLTKAAAAAAGALTGPAGWIATAALFARDLLKKFSSWLQRGIRKLFGLREVDPRRRNAIIFAAIAGALLLAGFLPGAIVAGGVALGYAAASAGGITSIASAGQALIYGITSVVIPSVAIPTLLAIIAIPLITAFILFIINTSAYLVPPGLFTIGGLGSGESPYIGVEKKAEPSGPFANNTQITVNYTITITAKKDTLTDIVFTYDCKVLAEYNQTCPAIGNISAGTASGDKTSYPSFQAIQNSLSLISPTDPFVITYTVIYSSGQYNNSLVIDTFKVSADAAGVPAEASGFASITIGTPPTGCFAVVNNAFQWPANLQNNLLQAVSTLVKNYSSFAAKVCNPAANLAKGFDKVNLCYNPADVPPGNCSGVYYAHHEHTPNCDINFNECGLKSSSDALFILTHEATHHIQKIDGSWFQLYLDSGAESEGSLCSYSGTIGNPYEGMAEGDGLFVGTPSWVSCISSYQTQYPLHYRFARDVMFR